LKEAGRKTERKKIGRKERRMGKEDIGTRLMKEG
jgi:hypothetical protein